MNILGTAVLATILLFSDLPMAQAGGRHHSGVTLYWSKGDVSVGLVSRYGSLGHGSHSVKPRRYVYGPRYKFPGHPRWHQHRKYFEPHGRLSHRKYFTHSRSFKSHRHFKPRGHIRHGSSSIHARPFTQRGRFGYYRNFTRQSRSSDGYLRGLGVR